MSLSAGIFYAFASVLLFAAFRVITARNPVHAALFLVLTFFQAALVWMLLKAEFLSIVLVLVYVGAVMVLFLFVVMMLDINVENLRVGFWKHFPIAAIIGVIVALEMSWVLFHDFFKVAQEAEPVLSLEGKPLTNTQILGKLLYTHYLYAVEVAASILTVAVIAAIGLTLRARKDSKYVSPGDQVRVKARDRMRVVKMTVTTSQVVSAEVGEENKL